MAFRLVLSTIGATAAAIGLSTAAFADSVTQITTITAVSSVQPARCTTNPCTIQISGTQSSSHGGTGTFLSVGSLSLTPSGGACFSVTGGSLTLIFPAGKLVFSTTGSHCGSYDSTTRRFTVSGPATLSSASGPGFTGWTAAGTGHVTSSVDPAGATLTLTGLAVPVTTPPPAGGGGGEVGGGGGGGSLAATPELGSLGLFGSGVAGMIGYSLAFVRRRRRSE